MWRRAGLVSTVLNKPEMEGDLGELLIYDTELTDLQIKQIEGYLAYKWGLQGSFATPTTQPFFFPIRLSGWEWIFF